MTDATQDRVALIRDRFAELLQERPDAETLLQEAHDAGFKDCLDCFRDGDRRA